MPVTKRSLRPCTQSGGLKAGFPLGEFVRANRKKKRLDWLVTNTDDIRANKFAKWKTGFKPGFHLSPTVGDLHCRCLLMIKIPCISEIILSFNDYRHENQESRFYHTTFMPCTF